MAERGDVTINPVQRLIKVAAPSTELTIQDLHDTIEGTQEELDFLQWPKFIDSAGKQVLDADTNVGITATLQESAKVLFEARNTPAQIGTVTTPDSGGVTLIDSAATFITNNVEPGSAVVNFSDKSIGTVYRVISETELELMEPLEDGADDEFGLGDDYRVYNITVCRVSGGNLVGLDDAGDPAIPFQPTFGVAFDRTSSASATQTEQEALQYSSFQNAVWIKLSGSQTGTVYPAGNKQNPVNNLDDALLIALHWGFTTFQMSESITLGSSVVLNGYKLVGLSPLTTHIVIEDSAACNNLSVENCKVTGVLDNGTKITECNAGDLAHVNGFIDKCGLFGTIALSGGLKVVINNCVTMDQDNPPIIDMGGSGQSCSMPTYSGIVTFTELADETQEIGVGLAGGMVVLDPTITKGTVVLAGTGVPMNNAGPDVIVNTDGLISSALISKAVHDEQIDTHKIDGSFGKVVSDMRYGGFVWVDVANGVSGTGDGVGTQGNPSNNISDSKIIAGTVGTRQFKIRGTVTLLDSFDGSGSGYMFIGAGAIAEDIIMLNGQNIGGCYFEQVTVYGEMIGPATWERCVLYNLSNAVGIANNCGYRGTLGLGGVGEAFLGNDIQGITRPVTIDMVGAGRVCQISGAVELVIKNAGIGAIANFTLNSGSITYESSCIAGASSHIDGVNIRKDNQGEISVIDHSLSALHGEGSWEGIGDVSLIADAVWAKVIAGTFTAAEMLEFLKAMEEGRWEITDDGGGTWNVYKEDNITLIASFETYDESGTRTNDPTRIVKRIRI